MLLLFSHSIILANNTKINMNFKGADIRDVLRTIAELADVNLVTDGSVNGDITIHLKNLSFEDSLKLITQAHNLAYKWYENTVVVATSERIDQIYADIMVKTVNVNHADLAEIQGIVKEVYPDLGVTLDQRNGNLIIRGKDEKISAAEDLIRKLDTQREEVTKVIPIPAEKSEFLKNYIKKVYPDLVIESDDSGNFVIYGSPYDIKSANLLLSRLIEQLNKKENTTVNKLPVNVIQSIKIRHLDVEYINEQISKMYPDVNIVADTVNNQLLYNGSNENLQEIKQLVEAIDLENVNKVEDEELYEKVVSIEFANIDNIKTAIQDISQTLNVKVLTGTNQLLINGTESDVEMAATIAENLDTEQKKYTEIVSIDYASQEDLEGILTNLYPDIGFTYNVQSKEIVINSTEKVMKDVLALINKIDIPRKQVIIEVRVEEVSSTDLSDMGINSDQMSKIEIIDSNEDGFIDGVGLTFADFIKAIETKGTSNTLANPRLMTLSGEEASQLIGNRIPVIVEKVEDGHVTSTIEYIEAGINLTFTPWVTKNNKVNLKVNPQVSSIGESIGTSLPPINTREVETTVRLNDGQTFAIGGLIQEDLLESISKVPLLAEIPIFGELFRSRSVENIKTELIIFITPHIVKEDSLNNSDKGKESDQNNLDSENDVDNESIVNAKEEAGQTNLEDIKETNQENTVTVNTEDEGKNRDNETEVNMEDDSEVVSEDNNPKEFIPLTKEELDAILGNNEKSQKKTSNSSDKKVTDNNDEVLEDSSEKTVETNPQISQEYNQNEQSTELSNEKGNEDSSEDDQNQAEEAIEVEENQTNEISELKKETSDIEEDKELNSNDKEDNVNDAKVKEEVSKQEVKVSKDSSIESSSNSDIDLSDLYLYNYKLLSEITVKELAEKFDVKEEFIIEANKDIEATVGSYIKIPVAKSRIYIFKKGDTLWRIHSLYDIAIDKIKEINNIEDENDISVGTEIIIPNKI